MKKLEIRFLYDLKKVLYDKKWLKTADNLELYYIYRGIKQKGEIRYDITIIPPQMLGKEFVKTKGHYHIGKYQELYKVLKGQAIFLLQKGKPKIEKIYAVKAKKNDIVIIPSNYGHITINPTKKTTLELSNWVSKKCKSNYKPVEEMKGAAYFYTKSGWKKNKNYQKIPKLCFEKPLNPVRKNKILKAIEALNFSNGVKSMPKNLEFLN